MLLTRLLSAFVLNSLATLTGIFEHPKDVIGRKTCASLQDTLGKAMVLTSGDKYLSTINRVWNYHNTEYRPACIVYPRNSAHVQTTMNAIYRNKVRYAVTAGGHSGMKGWNNVHDGVLIAFSHMRDATYNIVNDTITLQPGITWEDAAAAVEPYGVAPLGGRIGGVGTGLLLGGGLNYISPEYGWSADLFKELDVVLVTGELVTATATNEYADLFRALKGGANRFGIVTRYELYPAHTGTKEDKRWYGGVIMYPDSSAEAVVEATAKYFKNVRDPKAALMVTLIYMIVDGIPTAYHLTIVFYRGPQLPESIFGDFLNIPATYKNFAPASYLDVLHSLGSGNETGSGQIFGGSSFAADASSKYLDAFRSWRNYTMTFKDELDQTLFDLTLVPDSQIIAGQMRGGNAINAPRGGYGVVVYSSQFRKGVMNVSPEVQRGHQLLLEQVPRCPGLPLYVAEVNEQQPAFETYGSYEFLKRTYAKYDPTRFNMEHTDGPMGL